MSLRSEFNPSKAKAPPPFSLRLTADERRRLEDEAKGTPLGPYIKAKALGNPPPKIRGSRLKVEDRTALAKALAQLGASRIASNLNQLAHLGNVGALPFTPEIEAELAEVLADIREIRALLIEALGLNAGRSA